MKSTVAKVILGGIAVGLASLKYKPVKIGKCSPQLEDELRAKEVTK